MNELLLLPFLVALYVVGWLCWRAAQDEPNQEDGTHSGAATHSGEDPHAARGVE